MMFLSKGCYGGENGSIRFGDELCSFVTVNSSTSSTFYTHYYPLRMNIHRRCHCQGVAMQPWREKWVVECKEKAMTRHKDRWCWAAEQIRWFDSTYSVGSGHREIIRSKQSRSWSPLIMNYDAWYDNDLMIWWFWILIISNDHITSKWFDLIFLNCLRH